MLTVCIETYLPNRDPRAQAKAQCVTLGDLRLWFSYRRVVAFQVTGQPLRVCVNYWGRTTGSHLNAIDGGHKANRLPIGLFERLLENEIRSRGLCLAA